MASLLPEVEIMDNTLPFTSDLITTKIESSKSVDGKKNNDIESDSKPKILAPTIEEVDEDPETLRTLRGQGRYFGVGGDDDDKNAIKEAVPKCSNCAQRGHLKKNCPHVICTYCGAMDDHYSKHCPKAIKCANCNENGHYRSQCPHKWKRVYCTLCNSKRHSRDRCPSIWRVYLIKDMHNDKDNKKQAQQQIPFDKIYCYNCGSQGHFGDDCDQRRSSRVPNDDGSAFSGDNLPSKFKRTYYNYINDTMRSKNRPSLFDEYRNNSSNNSSGRGSNRSHNNTNKYSRNQNDEFNYDDYELDEAYYDDNNNNNNNNNRFNNNSKKRKRSDNKSSYNDNNRNKRNRSYNGDNYNDYGRNSHPLDFPRSNRNNSNSISNNMQSSRYQNNGGSRNNNRGGNYNQSSSKNYNSYKPFRSGTIRR